MRIDRNAHGAIQPNRTKIVPAQNKNLFTVPPFAGSVGGASWRDCLATLDSRWPRRGTPKFFRPENGIFDACAVGIGSPPHRVKPSELAVRRSCRNFLGPFSPSNQGGPPKIKLATNLDDFQGAIGNKRPHLPRGNPEQSRRASDVQEQGSAPVAPC